MSGRAHKPLCIGVAALAATLFASPVPAAQPAPPSGGANGAEILFLGTAGGPPLRRDRSEPATLMIVDGRQYLIDCGIGTARRMVESGIDSKEIKTIFFTHLHADHDMGRADVMANDFFEREAAGAADPINIYGPPQTRELVNSAFRFISVGFRPFAAGNFLAYQQVGGKFVSPFVAHEIGHDGVALQDGRIRVTAAENSHYAGIAESRRGAFKSYSYSYRFDTPNGSIVFTGDTGPSEAVTALSRGADVLVTEATYRDPDALDRMLANTQTKAHWTAARARIFGEHFRAEHLDAAEVGDLASKAGVKAVVIYHYSPKDKADQAKWIAEVKSLFAGPVYAADDLARYCISSGVLEPCGTAATGAH